MRNVYNSLDIFIFPSHQEGFGNPPMEAMACGVACVSTRVGAVPDYAEDGRTALLVEPGDRERLAEAVIELLSDEDRRRRLAEAGCASVGRFTWDSTVERLETLFLETLEAGS